MGLFEVDFSASAVDTNIMEGHIAQKSAVPRRVVRVGCASATNTICEWAADILYGSMKVMHVTNISHLNAAGPCQNNQTFWHGSKLTLPPGIPLNVIITDAPAAGAVLTLDIQDLSVR